MYMKLPCQNSRASHTELPSTPTASGGASKAVHRAPVGAAGHNALAANVPWRWGISMSHLPKACKPSGPVPVVILRPTATGKELLPRSETSVCVKDSMPLYKFNVSPKRSGPNEANAFGARISLYCSSNEVSTWECALLAKTANASGRHRRIFFQQ